MVLHRLGKGGLGTAYVAGMTRALAEGADYMVQMDADFSHSPAYIPANAGRDAGHRCRRGDRQPLRAGRLARRRAGSRCRRLLSWWANLYSRAILGLRIRDMTAGFKLWRARRPARPSAWRTSAATATASRSKWPTCARSWASAWSRSPSTLKTGASARASSTSRSSSNRPGAPGRFAGAIATWNAASPPAARPSALPTRLRAQARAPATAAAASRRHAPSRYAAVPGPSALTPSAP